jgi:hypothetical protein
MDWPELIQQMADAPGVRGVVLVRLSGGFASCAVIREDGTHLAYEDGPSEADAVGKAFAVFQGLHWTTRA